MKYIQLVLHLTLCTYCLGQSAFDRNIDNNKISKPNLNIEANKNWPSLSDAGISNDGKFAGYITLSDSLNRVLKLICTENKWKIESSIKGSYKFTMNSNKAVWINAHDSLCIALLGTSNIFYISDVSLYNIGTKDLSYFLTNSQKEFVIEDTNSPSSNTYHTADKKILLDNGKMRVLLQTQQGKVSLLADDDYGNTSMLWSGVTVRNLLQNETSEQLAFFSNSRLDSITYYKVGMDTTVSIAVSIDPGFRILDLSRFSRNGEYIFLDIIEQDTSIRKAVTTSVNIWSYVDNELQTQQRKELGLRTYTAVIRLSDKNIFRLDKENDWLFLPRLQDTVALIRQQERRTTGQEINWNRDNSFTWHTISLKDGRENNLPNINQNNIVQLSPCARYVLYYDTAKKDYFVYETGSGRLRNITSGIAEKWQKNIDEDDYGQYIAGWEEADKSVFINGKRDIWQIDPSGVQLPINLTNGCGSKYNIRFSLSLREYSMRSIHRGESLILTAFNLGNKENGFYRKKVGHIGNPEPLCMGPYIYDIPDNPFIPDGVNYSPIKALHADKYLVRRMSATEAPNYFVTTDFKSFKPISDLQPQRSYNWYTTELHQWESLAHHTLQGVLYKPENFNPEKRYPIILYCYEKMSDGLNAYLEPNVLESGCAINIPYYVSNGYLVFCPDIYYQLGDPMQNAYDALISAVNHLTQLSYVNSTKMGIQGCSWGAVETNYLVTHTNLFTAACSASGIGNWVSGYNSIMGSGESMQGMYEIGQFRIGKTLWENPNVYIKSSAVLLTDSMTTPLLLMHTTNDEIFPLANIQEFFSTFQHLKKKAWMLVYNGNHGIFGNDAIDFSIRMKQFFDHFLQSYPLPEWMIRTKGQH